MGDLIGASQREQIARYSGGFAAYLRSPEGLKDDADRRARIDLYSALTADRLSNLTEDDIEAIVGGLWASRIWSNLKYLTNKILTDNGLEVLRTEFTELITGEAPLPRRYERFLHNVKGLGPASVTEMLCYSHPRECGIWNDKARTALQLLGFASVLPLKKYRITADELARFVEVLVEIGVVLQENRTGPLDLLQVDFFLYQVLSAAVTEAPSVPMPNASEFDHDEIKDKVREIGGWLGFEVETERTIGRGARIDAIWRAAIGHLGVVTYAFEVHRAGSIDSLVLNLQRAKGNPTVQKVIAVSDEDQLSKIRREVEDLPEDFRLALAYWRVSSVQRVHQNLSEAMDQIQQLELVKDLRDPTSLLSRP